MSLELLTIHPTKGTLVRCACKVITKVNLCDECAAGPKSTDHTLTCLDHFIEMYIDKWVQHLTLCLDKARICKK